MHLKNKKKKKKISFLSKLDITHSRVPAVLLNDQRVALTGCKWLWPGSPVSLRTLLGNRASARFASLPSGSSLSDRWGSHLLGHPAAQPLSARTLQMMWFMVNNTVNDQHWGKNVCVSNINPFCARKRFSDEGIEPKLPSECSSRSQGWVSFVEEQKLKFPNCSIPAKTCGEKKLPFSLTYSWKVKAALTKITNLVLKPTRMINKRG